MRSQKYLAFMICWLCVSCVSLTVNVYFPKSEMEKAAEEIEGRIRSGQGVEGLEETMAPIPAHARHYLALSLDGIQAYAADEIDININTPTVKSIIKSRTKRFKELVPQLDSGIFGEGYNGYLVLRDKTGLDLKQMTELKKLLNEENEDREKLYFEILRANSLSRDEENVEQVGKIFAEAIQKKLKKGRWYQKDKDTWVQKKEDPKKEDGKS
ncbi:YdbL family protein [bacterium]|nr:YdbL family protein [bacterium]